jgi:hypothetical protein
LPSALKHSSDAPSSWRPDAGQTSPVLAGPLSFQRKSSRRRV